MVANLFDANFYRLANPDLAAAGVTTDAQLRDHFLRFGADEGRRFSPFINLGYYRTSNPDLALAGLTTNRQAFEHLEQFGLAEGRRFSVVFNPAFYRSRNPDLVAARLTSNEQLYEHYKNFGTNEGRVASEFFEPSFYLNNNADLRAVGFNFRQAVDHFLNFGIREGRLASPPVSPVQDPGLSTSTALGLGTLLAKASLVNFVGPTNPEDYYLFTLDKPSNVNLSLSSFNSPAQLRLFVDSNTNFRIDPGEQLNTVSSFTPINRTLGAGSYYVDVVTGSSFPTVYQLDLNATPSPTTNPTDPGNTPNNALNLGTLSGTRVLQDFVGSTDRNDFYRFVLGNISNLNLSLTSVSEPVLANIFADRNNNNAIEPSEYVANVYAGAGSINAITQNLGPGTYFVDVIPGNQFSNTNYIMSLSA
ncbi:hypothetical protein [Microseira wollei]|uniref:Peptidase C-terminal archaeal/bacterial domain-containing protein n=1 Tax=Microseira wollei NIES-4236 TaxID=2530354 RepID=A0AAV3XL40_9CYAN|nr:hypothetical protein [Microseira wollei]GET42298.1 hypothetical protein MiSe_71140 [Microseira wollei NIES-4236]